MKNKQLSILIPARNEMFVSHTVEDILKNIEADTEIIVTLDGGWIDPAISQHERVNVIHISESIGQRAATNIACNLSKAKYVMKMDAHCSFDKGFDRIMIEGMNDNWTMAPTMRNLWAFDWVCDKCGFKIYQDKKSICPNCNIQMKRKMLWIGKERPQSNSFSFDPEPHFQYFRAWSKRPENRATDINESMSLQGSCFMCTREKYLELNLCDESLGSWGNQGIEVALKTWLSGGKVMVNKKTWYAHMFRTKGINDFGFPYRQPGNEVLRTKQRVKDLFWTNSWDKQIHPVSWLVEKFWPVPNWSEEDLEKIK